MTWTEKLSDLAEKHWKLILFSSIATVAAGGAIYALSSRKPSRKPATKKPQVLPAESTEKLEHVSQDGSNPVSPTKQIDDENYDATSKNNNAHQQEVDAEDPNENEADIDISTLSESERDELALAAKTRGNKYFSGQKYEKAITLYSKAIALYPKLEKKSAVFYSNRAACWANLNDYDKVIEDCTTALEIDPLYTKAIARRGNAYEKKEMYGESLEDLTTACILEEFKIQSTLMAADRALRNLSTKKAKEVFANLKKQDLPSLSFVTAYLKSFRYEYLPSINEADLVPGSGDALYYKAAQAFSKQNWEKASKLIDSALLASPQQFLGAALNMRGTFLFLKGLSDAAKEDFEESLRLEPSANTMIKLASVCMEKDAENGIEEARKWFSKALELNDKDPDVYYHRGQIYFLTQEYQKAYEDYTKSLEIDENFVLAKIQMAIVKYRLGEASEAHRLFEATKRQHPKVSDVYYYHGEIMLDQQKVEDALSLFDRAIELNPSSPLAYLNKGIIYFHMKTDFDKAIEYTQKAIDVDGRCDLAYNHLAQMFMQQGRLDEAVITFKRAIDLARTLTDVENAVMGLEAVMAQSAAFKRISQHKSIS